MFFISILNFKKKFSVDIFSPPFFFPLFAPSLILSFSQSLQPILYLILVLFLGKDIFNFIFPAFCNSFFFKAIVVFGFHSSLLICDYSLLLVFLLHGWGSFSYFCNIIQSFFSFLNCLYPLSACFLFCCLPSIESFPQISSQPELSLSIKKCEFKRLRSRALCLKVELVIWWISPQGTCRETAGIFTVVFAVRT